MANRGWSMEAELRSTKGTIQMWPENMAMKRRQSERNLMNQKRWMGEHIIGKGGTERERQCLGHKKQRSTVLDTIRNWSQECSVSLPSWTKPSLTPALCSLWIHAGASTRKPQGCSVLDLIWSDLFTNHVHTFSECPHCKVERKASRH